MMFGLNVLYHAFIFTVTLNGADAFWRLPCRGRSGLGLVDPIKNYGEPAAHAHTLHGSSSFGLHASNADMMQGDCTSCGVKQDLSTYWTPAMYFMYPNGTSVIVDQVGGMLAYYLQYGDDLVEFPPGFQVIAGDSERRNFTCQQPEPPKSEWSGEEISQPSLEQKAIGFNCLNYGQAPEPSLGRHNMPSKQFMDENCADGMRLEVFFPSCWNGEDATSPDHKSHMAYPSLINAGDCPKGYPKRTASLFYETIWNTAAFSNTEGAFVLSTGDSTGNSYHGDFMAGWQPGFLQQAIDTCTALSGDVEDCPLFDLNTEAQMKRCEFPTPPLDAQPECQGPMEGLPGSAQFSPGPADRVAAEIPNLPPWEVSSFASAAPSAPISIPKAHIHAADSEGASTFSAAPSRPTSPVHRAPDTTTGDVVFAQDIAAPSATTSPSADAPASTGVPPPPPQPPSPPSISIPPPSPTTVPPTCDDTTTIFRGGDQYDICITDVTSYVTASAPSAPAAAKRWIEHVKVHQHHHGHF